MALLLAALAAGAPQAFAQKVGVVLSGGGARGLAHIGVLKALEERHIPIDYLAGSSMGGIVAGMYAAGMSPTQMERIALSKELSHWVNGTPKDTYTYGYNRREVDPSFIQLPFSLDSTFSFSRSATIAKDWALNFALAENTAQALSVSHDSFDSLFVPIRLMAAEIFTQHKVILRSGVLSDAMRATQTVPFFYNPIKIDDKYMFDGGLYDNFPVDVMVDELHPDVIIGSNVATRAYEKYPYGKDYKLLTRPFLLAMLNNNTPEDSMKLSSKDIYISPNLRGYTALNFEAAKSLIDSGYVQTLRQIDEIRAKIVARYAPDSLERRRQEFFKKLQPMRFSYPVLEGFNRWQRRYISAAFTNKKSYPQTLEGVRKDYYRLMSEGSFNSLYFTIQYDSIARKFQFKLVNRRHGNLRVDFGGAIATRNISSVFLGINHFYFGRAFVHTQLDFYGGAFYKSAGALLRVHVPKLRSVYFVPQFTYNNWSFMRDDALVADRISPLRLLRIDFKTGLTVSYFTGPHATASLYGFYVNSRDQYPNIDNVSPNDIFDDMRLSGVRVGASFTVQTLNRKQYASRGKSYFLSVDWFSLRERFTPGTTSVADRGGAYDRKWIRIRATAEQYFPLGKYYSIGAYLDGVFSTQPTFSNYSGTVFNAPAFLPLQDSKTFLLNSFRTFNFFAVGMRNVISFHKSIDLRLEGYIFKPLQLISLGENQQATLSNANEQFYFVATADLVFHSAIGPVSLSVNYYNDAYGESRSQFNVLLHVGFLLFNRASLE